MTTVKGEWVKRGHIGDYLLSKAEKLCMQMNGHFATPMESFGDEGFQVNLSVSRDTHIEYRLGDPENGKPGYRGIYSYLWQEEKK